MKKLRNKILFLTLGLITFLGLTVILFAHISFTDALETELRGKGVSLTKNLTALSLDNLLTENYLRLHIQLSDFKHSNQDIKYIFVTNNEGNVISHTFEGGFPSALRNAHIIKSDTEYSIQSLKSGAEIIMDVGVPILKGSLGVLHMGLSENHLKETIRNKTWGLVGILTAVLIAGLIIAVVFSSAITKPVTELTEAAIEIGKGDLDREVHVKTKDEIGNLAAIFNSMTRELKLSSSQLEQSNKELRDFLTIASHDLQEPLRKVRVMGDRLMATFSDTLQDKGRDYVERMQKSITQMQSLINGLIAFSSVASRAPVYTSVGLDDIAQKVLSDLKMRVDRADANVAISDLPVIDADPHQMYHLLHNLVDNALKFNRNDKQSFVKVTGSFFQGSKENSIGDDPDNDYCLLSVEDNGIGIDEEHKDRIYTVCQRLHDKSEFDGAGMGLSICRKIVENHDGMITVKSTPGQGTTFTVSLPVQQSDKNKTAIP